MGFALRKQPSDQAKPAGIPLKKRLYAWWNGYELRRRAAPGSGEDRDTGHGGALRDVPRCPWSEERRQLAHELWSPGFILPGGQTYVQKLVSGCNLTEAETLLEIGIGMAGSTRTIIGKFGNYVTGYERDPELAAAARRYAVTYEFDDKLEVIEDPFSRVRLKPGYYRAALLREVLYSVEDKARLLGQVAAALKGGESFVVITDFLFDAGETSPALADWIAAEDRPVFPWTEDELTECLKANRITPRIVEDESHAYSAMVVDGWTEYLRAVRGGEISEEMGRQMEREGEFWARRVAALEAGTLRYYRIEGIKVS